MLLQSKSRSESKILVHSSSSTLIDIDESIGVTIIQEYWYVFNGALDIFKASDRRIFRIQFDKLQK